jgi:hypothetical protein
VVVNVWPHDFRTADPILPSDPDPKQFKSLVRPGSYYLPYEACTTMGKTSQKPTGSWFWHPGYVTSQSQANLAWFYARGVAQNNACIVNLPPDRNGRFVPSDVDMLIQTAQAMGVSRVFPARITSVRTSLQGLNTTVALEWNGWAREYLVQESPSLKNPVWTTVAGPITGTNFILQRATGNPFGFFRVESR